MTARAMTRPARFFLGAGTTALALALGGVPLFLTAQANAAAPDKIDICHATSNVKGPYVIHQPAKTADAGGHAGHTGPVFVSGMTSGWGDIIPPFDYPATNKEPAGHFPGLNWTPEGQDFFHNGLCDGDGIIDPGGTTGDPTTGTTGDPTTGTTGDPTTGTTGDPTTGTTGDPTSGTTGDTSTSGTTGGGGGATTGFTGGGGGGTVNVPPAKPTKPAAQGGGTVVGGNELPFTGSNSQTLALWGLASLIGGVGFCSLGQRGAKRAL